MYIHVFIYLFIFFILQDGLQGMVHHPEFLKQGHVMVMERRGGISGMRYTCIKLFTCCFAMCSILDVVDTVVYM